jgi:plasmid stabilization system protein ParE
MVLKQIDRIAKTPEMFEADQLRLDQNKQFRTFTSYSYRVTYYVEAHLIFILRVRHTSMEPLEY